MSKIQGASSFTTVPVPGTPDDRLRRYTSYPSTASILEVNAGEGERFGIEVGNKVELENIDDHCDYRRAGLLLMKPEMRESSTGSGLTMPLAGAKGRSLRDAGPDIRKQLYPSR